MNKQMLKKLSAIALAVAMLQGVALTSAISYSAVETEQVEASGTQPRFPIGTTVRYGYIENEWKYVECEYKQCGDYTYYVTDDGKGAVIAGEQYVTGYYVYGGLSIEYRSGYQGNDTEVVIPSELDGLPVVELDKNTFYCREDICSVVIPGSVKTIDSNAFESVNRGLRIQLSEGLEKIDDYAFWFSTSTPYSDNAKVVIPSSVKTLGYNIVYRYGINALVFSKNSQLNKVELYESVFQSSFGYCGENFDVLVPDDFNMTGILPDDYYGYRRNKPPITYYTEKNKTMVEYANSDEAVRTKKMLVKLELTDKNVSLKTNEEYELKSNLRQQSLIDCCTWQSSDTSVATVDEKGKVTAVGVGTATITMTTENEMQASCTVNVSQNESDLAMTKPNLKVGLNQKYKLALNQTDVKGTWSSSDTSVVTVNKSGNVTAVGVGTAMITFTSEEGEKATCLINVAESKISDLGLSSHKSMKGLGRNYSLTPNDIRISGCTWKSSDTKVVTVNQYGIVKTVGVGTANVTVTDKFGNKFTCKVKVGI